MKYRKGTTEQQIIEDGWSRGFLPSQISQELQEQGLKVDLGILNSKLSELDKKYELSQNL